MENYTLNYDFEGWKNLMELITLKKNGVSYNPELTSIDSEPTYLDRIKDNRNHRFHGGRVIAEELDLDRNTPDNIIILNTKDLLASIDEYELND
jgi:hypothetical protein